MKVSRSWLQSYVDLTGRTDDEISRAITFLGFEVEGIVRTGAPKLEHVFVGEVLTRDKHPNADKLSVCTVDVGPTHGVKTIVCGAQNYTVGDRVPVALPGAVLPGDFVIKQSKIRGASSDGMMCSGRELGIGEDHSGLLILTARPALGTPINEVLPAGDTIFDLEITPNRPDCLSHFGVARELAAWFRTDLAYPALRFRGDLADAAQAPALLTAVRVEAPEDCPLYTAHLVVGVKIGPSPAWLQDRLTAVGLRPINNVVDVTNFVMLESGQPLHAFDAKHILGGQIIVRHARDGEKLVTLDGKERLLNSRMLVIADTQRPLVVAGIMGGLDSGVTDATTDVVLEVAHFRRQAIRWTSKRLQLSSDSSYRFERGTDPHAALEVAYRALDLLAEVTGGRIVGPAHRVGGCRPWQREITVTPTFLRQRLGFQIPDTEMRTALEALELRVTHEQPAEEFGDRNLNPAWTVAIPSWRDDLDRPIDLVEEVLRLYGTEKIPPATVIAPGLIAEDDPVVQFTRRATDYLVGQNFHECVTYTLRAATEIATWASQTAATELRLANPFLDDQSHLRPTLVLGLLESLNLNQARGVAVTHLCEAGRVFIERNGQNWECAAVAFVIAEDAARTWQKREAADFFTVKHHVTQLAAAAGIDLARQPLAPVQGSFFGWQEGHHACAGEMAHGWTARFGLLNLALVRSLGLTGKVHAGIFAILPEKLAAVATGARKRFTPFALVPAALRDLALVVDASAPAEEVRKTIAKAARTAAGNAFALESVELFDVYQGQGVPEGKKSLAFALTFRSPERTLTDTEVGTAFAATQTALEQAGYTIRR